MEVQVLAAHDKSLIRTLHGQEIGDRMCIEFKDGAPAIAIEALLNNIDMHIGNLIYRRVFKSE